MSLPRGRAAKSGGVGWLRFAVAETLGGGAFAIASLLVWTRGFRTWRESSDPVAARLPHSPTEPAARALYIGIGAVGALEGLAFVLVRPLLPRRAVIAGPLFSSLSTLLVGHAGRKRYRRRLATIDTVTTSALSGSVLALVERLSRSPQRPRAGA